MSERTGLRRAEDGSERSGKSGRRGLICDLLKMLQCVIRTCGRWSKLALKLSICRIQPLEGLKELEAVRSGEVENSLEKSKPRRCLIRSRGVFERIIGRRCLV